MKRIVCSFLTITIGFLAGCTLLRPPKEKEPPKAQLVLSYWDVGAGDENQPRYDTKMSVFIDGELVGKSDTADRYDKKTLTLGVEPGTHVVIIEGLARRGGKWEKRTKERGYFVNHRLEKKIEIGKGARKSINFVVPDRAQAITIQP